MLLVYEERVFVHGFESDFFLMLDVDSGGVWRRCEIVSTRCWFHYAVDAE